MLGEDAEIVLAVGETISGGFAIPFRGEPVIGLVAGAAHADGEIVHRLDVALLRRCRIPGARLAEILGDALAPLIHGGETILGRGKPGAGGTLEPVRRLGQVLGDVLTLRITKRDHVLRARIAAKRRPGAKRADRALRAAGAAWPASKRRRMRLGPRAERRLLDAQRDAGRKRGSALGLERGELRPRQVSAEDEAAGGGRRIWRHR